MWLCKATIVDKMYLLHIKVWTYMLKDLNAMASDTNPITMQKIDFIADSNGNFRSTSSYSSSLFGQSMIPLQTFPKYMKWFYFLIGASPQFCWCQIDVTHQNRILDYGQNQRSLRQMVFLLSWNKIILIDFLAYQN